MGRKCAIAALSIAVVLFAGYIWLMACLQGFIRVENPSCIALNPEEKTVTLAWYLDPLVSHWNTSVSGDHSKFFYELPDLFEDSELIIVVSWPDERCILYAGESRGMDGIDMDFPDAGQK